MKRFNIHYCLLMLVLFGLFGSGCATTQRKTVVEGTKLEKMETVSPPDQFISFLIWGVMEAAYGLGQSCYSFEVK